MVPGCGGGPWWSLVVAMVLVVIKKAPLSSHMLLNGCAITLRRQYAFLSFAVMAQVSAIMRCVESVLVIAALCRETNVWRRRSTPSAP